LTTEDEEIAAVARENGVETPFLRPLELASDYAADADIVGHALDHCSREDGDVYDVIVMLQPTTPFTLPSHIRGCLERLAADVGLASCFTARPVREPPQWMFLEGADGRAEPVLKGVVDNADAHKQLLAEAWFPSGAAYAVRTSAFRAQRRIYATPFAFHPMQAERSIDIDEEQDFMIAETTARRHRFTPMLLAGYGR
jgi:CMP-N-acetylneuraminic acid synthetase